MKKEFRIWAKAAATRAVKTVAQAAVAMIGTSVIVSEVDWRMVVSASILAGVLSVLTSVAGLPEAQPVTIYDPEDFKPTEEE